MDAAAIKSDFMAMIRDNLSAQTFVKLTLGKPRRGEVVERCVVDCIHVKDETRLRFVTRHATRDVTTVASIDGGLAEIATQLGATYLSATLFTSERDISVVYNKRLEPRLTKSKATLKATAGLTCGTTSVRPHNRIKEYAVAPSRPYLVDLGVATADGMIKPSMYGKFKQICHFIEIVDDVIRASDLAAQPTVSVVDIGSGKGYLTFALYDYLTVRLAKSCRMSGIEIRPDLAAASRVLAQKLRLAGLTFEATEASASASSNSDLVIALHACDTATDDAIYRGISGNAAVIMCAPCCQHEIAPQLTNPADGLLGLVKFGLLKQRLADLVTDAARALLMEASGYKVKIIEFVSTEHTAKNLLIVGIRSPEMNRELARRQYAALKADANFTTQRLEQLLLQSATER